MSNSKNPNASGSGTTSPTGPGPKPEPGEKQPPPSEADFISRQQDEARAAIDNVVTDMKRALAQAGDIRQWTRSYPWITTAGAVVAGFFAGMALTPPKDESAKEFFEKKWESMKDRFAPAAESQEAQAAAEKGPKQKSASALGVILREVLKAVGPTIGGLVTGAVAGQQAQDTAEQAAAGNGHGGAAGGHGAGSTYPPPT